MNNSNQEKALILNTVYHTVPSDKWPCETDICRFHVCCLSIAPVSNMVTFQAVCSF